MNVQHKNKSQWKDSRTTVVRPPRLVTTEASRVYLTWQLLHVLNQQTSTRKKRLNITLWLLIIQILVYLTSSGNIKIQFKVPKGF